MKSIIVAAILFASVSVACAETLTELMLRRIAWITEHSEYTYNGEPLPRVEFISEETLINLHGGGDALAIYDYASNTMYFKEDYDPFSLDTAYYMVHELVHFLQMLSGELNADTCPGKMEPAAYEIHFRFQDEFGPVEKDANWLFIYMLASACSRDWLDTGPPR